ncbi:hypothetical protein [Mycobacterium senriense]|uniref:hypothetical protein n=1 Tax=Mycobacterium senriense TaxID=2775496 RepID=UPI001C7E5CEB|nr:hypothetical protein [Mycobacterium senriense]
MSSEVDRGSSGCTYNNGENAFSAKTFVAVSTIGAGGFDHELTNEAGRANITDVPGLGVDAKLLTTATSGQALNLLIVKVDAQRAISVQVAPNGDQHNSTQVATLILARMQNG